MSILITLIIFGLTLGILVISHELGHFLAAKRFGIKVLEFGFGLPPKIWQRTIGETTWSLNALPIGGFVRLLGEDEEDLKVRNDKRSFATQPVWQRMVVVMAGVTMNLLLAWLLFYTILFVQDFRIIFPTPDPILSVAEVQDDFPAAQAGLKAGERIFTIDNQTFTDSAAAVDYIHQRKDQPVTLTVGTLEGENMHTLTVTPKPISDTEARIGVAFSPIPFKQYNTPTEKLFSGITYSWDLTRLTFQGLGKLGTDLGHRDFQNASKSVSGPVGLVGITHSIVQLGLNAIMPYLWFMGVISLTLAIFNSIPFPALDGGRFIFLVYEAVVGKKPNAAFEHWVHMVGMIFLLGLMVVITYSDILKLNLF